MKPLDLHAGFITNVLDYFSGYRALGFEQRDIPPYMTTPAEQLVVESNICDTDSHIVDSDATGETKLKLFGIDVIFERPLRRAVYDEMSEEEQRHYRFVKDLVDKKVLIKKMMKKAGEDFDSERRKCFDKAVSEHKQVNRFAKMFAKMLNGLALACFILCIGLLKVWLIRKCFCF